MEQCGDALLRVLEEAEDDPFVANLCINVLAHSIPRHLNGDTTRPKNEILVRLDPAVLNVLRHPRCHPSCFRHAIHLLLGTSVVRNFIANSPQVTECLVACLRVADIGTRWQALAGILAHPDGASSLEHFVASNKAETRNFERIYPWTPHQTEVLGRYHDAYLEGDKDMYKLGLDLVVPLSIPIPPMLFVVSDGPLFDEDLPCAIDALRAAGPIKHADEIDVLLIHYHFLRDKPKDAGEVVCAAMRRSPNNAFFYFACLTFGDTSDIINTIRLAKRGLLCLSLTPLPRQYSLRQQAAKPFTHQGDSWPQADRELQNSLRAWSASTSHTRTLGLTCKSANQTLHIGFLALL